MSAERESNPTNLGMPSIGERKTHTVCFRPDEGLREQIRQVTTFVGIGNSEFMRTATMKLVEEVYAAAGGKETVMGSYEELQNRKKTFRKK